MAVALRDPARHVQTQEHIAHLPMKSLCYAATEARRLAGAANQLLAAIEVELAHRDPRAEESMAVPA